MGESVLNCVLPPPPHTCECVWGGGVVGGKCVKLCTAHVVCVCGGVVESVLNCVLHM